MREFLTGIYKRLISHWQTSLVGLLLFGGYHAFYHGKIEFADLIDYLAVVPTIILLLMRDWKKEDPK
jgi:hypothetical protein